MKSFLLVLFILISGASFSQDMSKLLRQIDKESNSRNYVKALKTALQADSLYKVDYDTENSEYSGLLSTMGNIYYFLNKLDKADTCFRKSIENYKQYTDVRDEPNFLNTLNSYSSLLISTKHYTTAKTLIDEVLVLQKEKTGVNSEDYAYCLSILGSLQMNVGNNKEAESALLAAISIWKVKDNAKNSDYANALYDLAFVYSDEGQYKLALSLYLDVAKKFKRIWGASSSEYASALALLGSVYTELSDFDSAISSFQNAVEIIKKTEGDKSEDYADYIRRFATMYQQMGNYSKAEELYLQALVIQKEGGYVNENTLFYLSSLYQIMGNFAASEKLCLEVLSIDKKGGEDSAQYLYAQNLLANLYTLMGSYDKALSLYKNIVERSKAILGPANPDYAVNLDNLANLYLAINEYRKAESLTLEALEIKKAAFGELNPDIAYSLRNLGDVYTGLKDYSQAEIYRKKELEMNLKILGPEHNDYASSLAGLASIYLIEGKYVEAEQLYNQAIAIISKVFGYKHPEYGNLLLELAKTDELLGKSDAAQPNYIKVNENLNNQIKQNFSFMAEKEKEQFITTLTSNFEDINSFVYRRKGFNPSITSQAYNNELELKGIVLQSSKAIRQAALNSNDKELINLYDSFYKDKQLLTKLSMLPPEGRWINADSLEAVCTEKEKELNRKIQSLTGKNDFSGIGSQVKWEDVQKALGADEAAIEYLSFHDSNLKNTADSSILYCALLLKAGMNQPEMIPLFKEAELLSLLKETRSPNDATTVGRLYQMPSSETSGSQIKTENRLYKLIWEPIDTMLSGIKTIYYSPTGLLNKISFDAIPLYENNYLSDKYTLNAVLCTRAILDKENNKLQVNGNLKPVVFGGINYDSDTATMKSVSTRYVSNDTGQRGHFNPGDDNRGGSFSYLDGTLTEVEKIQKLLLADKANPVVITGNEATEESFKALNNLNSPVFIHIATHGFSFPEPKAKVPGKTSSKKSSFDPFKNSENPLLRSGLIFAGANHAWNNQPLPAGVEDGILLASEVAEMYLPNTQLVVLSACETGLGDIKGSEGVFGLQRAFKMAGVKYLIISLWQVPDYQTSELMSKFYENWLSGQKIQDSFRNAQNFLKQNYPGNPYDWAAFVLVQ